MTIYITADQTLTEIAGTIAHEWEHCRQFAKADQLLADQFLAEQCARRA